MKKSSLLTLFCLCLSLNASTIDTMIDKTQKSDKSSVISQKKINNYSDKSEKIYDEYVRLKKELNEQIVYNKQLDLIVETQRKEIPLLENQLEDIEVTNRKIIPLMYEMTQKLEEFISIDTPFLKEERTNRVQNLKNFLSTPNITTAEQFRTIWDSYKIEYSYSRTLEVYRSEMKMDDNSSKTVDFLRVGRFALYYQSLDFKESGIYNQETGKWMVLDEQYNELIKKGIKMARKKISPDFLTLVILSAKAEK